MYYIIYIYLAIVTCMLNGMEIKYLTNKKTKTKAKMCISMYKKTNAFLPLSMILKISSGSEMFNNCYNYNYNNYSAGCTCEEQKSYKGMSERNTVTMDECFWIKAPQWWKKRRRKKEKKKRYTSTWTKCKKKKKKYIFSTHARWELPLTTPVFVVVLAWRLSSAN